MRKSIANMATQRQVATTVSSVATTVSSVTTISNYGNRMVTLQVLPSSRVNALTVSPSNNTTRPSMCYSPAPLRTEVWFLCYFIYSYVMYIIEVFV